MHRQFHRFLPPRIPSPYLYGAFGIEFRRILSEYAAESTTAVEFGVLHGYSTSIIAGSMGGVLYSYDLFEEVPMSRVRQNIRDPRVHLERMNFFYWLTNQGYFDFLWIDIAASPKDMRFAHVCLTAALRRGAVVLSEGTRRLNPERRISVPCEELCSHPPGIFRMVP